MTVLMRAKRFTETAVMAMFLLTFVGCAHVDPQRRQQLDMADALNIALPRTGSLPGEK
jgi:hypothetical protein